jgi:type VI secretion system protein ImpL
MVVYLVTGGILLAYLVLAWFIGTWIPLQGSHLWILRGGLAFLGLAAAGTVLWFHRKKTAAISGAGGGGSDSSGTADVDLLVREAVRRLKSSTLGRGATLGKLPVVFLLGDSGSTKTTTIIHSALDPELLSGHVYQDNNILPTRISNIWYSPQAVFVDPAGDLLGQPHRWKRLIKLLRPGRLSTAMGKGRQAPRAAIVCFDCSGFLQPGASESTLSAARKLATRLQEISQLLSISFPVYVLFTKLDRVSFFQEFARGLSKEEAAEVLGATLPVRSPATGVYAEEETKRLTKAFDDLFYSLAERRLDLLTREHESDKLPGIYEFPRELRKLRTLLVQFLVDLVRPSQLSVNPFLRGFYLSGVRPVLVDDVAPAAPQAHESEAEFDAGATRIFGSVSRAAQAVPSRSAGSRKVPQWVFLTRLFNDVIVKDRVALAASGFSTRVNLFRRIVLGFVVLVAVICTIGFIVSFVSNYSIESNVRAAADDLRTVQPTGNQPPSLADLQKLDRLRQELVTLSSYKRDGVPVRVRWGLYAGDQIYSNARKIYFDYFYQRLFKDTQETLVKDLQSVPDKPGPNDPYDKTYNELKAYLITTSNNEKSTKDFLSPALTNHWLASRGIDPERQNLVIPQFDFYSTELAIANPFSSTNETAVIDKARKYLLQFGAIDHVYSPLLAEASRRNSSVSFNGAFPNSAGVIIGNHVVPGAFTKDGFAFMQAAMRDPSYYIHGEEWVLGKTTSSELDQSTLRQRLTQRYYAEFINEWLKVIQTSRVESYRDLADADKKLGLLTEPSSPLLELLWFISNNTNVGVADVNKHFQPVQVVEPPGTPGQYEMPQNRQYVEALAALHSNVDSLLQSPTGQNQVLDTQTLTAEANAETSVTQVMGGAQVDQSFHTENQVRRLLEEPITNLNSARNQGSKDALNQAGKAFCNRFTQITSKYPFNSKSNEDLSIDQLNAIFAPKTGALWTFYEKLAPFLPKQGSRYEPIPGGTAKPSSSFVDFFNRAASLSDAFYHSGAAGAPSFSYSLKEMPSNVTGLVLKVGNETLTDSGQPKAFTWTGGPEEIQVAARGVPLSSFTGSWAIFRFVAAAHSQVSGAVTTLEWVIQTNNQTIIINGKEESYRYQLQVDGYNPFRTSEFSGLHCVSQVVP